MAIDNRGEVAGTMIHSDKGAQFGSWAFTQRAKESGFAAVDGVRRRLLRQRPDEIVLALQVVRRRGRGHPLGARPNLDCLTTATHHLHWYLSQ